MLRSSLRSLTLFTLNHPLLRPSHLPLRLPRPCLPQWRRCLNILAIETSADDTCCAVLSLEREPDEPKHLKTELLFNRRVTSNNLQYGGIHPIRSMQSHHASLALLVDAAMESIGKDKKPDMVAVTRGPGMRTNLQTGIDVAKGLSVAWQVPLIPVHHMHAHALSYRLHLALSHQHDKCAFPFWSLLVSGGHTILVESKTATEHRILASTVDIAIGDCLDKAARLILPRDMVEKSGSVSYGGLLEAFAFRQEDLPLSQRSASQYDYQAPSSAAPARSNAYGWYVPRPFSKKGDHKSRSTAFSFAGIVSHAERIVKYGNTHDSPRAVAMSDDEARTLARAVMEAGFEHVADRICLALESTSPGASSVSRLALGGGVASNNFLRHILRTNLEARCPKNDMGLGAIPPALCTDNAAMIAWAAAEMVGAIDSHSPPTLKRQWEKNDLSFGALRRWSLENLMAPAKEEERELHEELTRERKQIIQHASRNGSGMTNDAYSEISETSPEAVFESIKEQRRSDVQHMKCIVRGFGSAAKKVRLVRMPSETQRHLHALTLQTDERKVLVMRIARKLRAELAGKASITQQSKLALADGCNTKAELQRAASPRISREDQLELAASNLARERVVTSLEAIGRGNFSMEEQERYTSLCRQWNALSLGEAMKHRRIQHIMKEGKPSEGSCAFIASQMSTADTPCAQQSARSTDTPVLSPRLTPSARRRMKRLAAESRFTDNERSMLATKQSGRVSRTTVSSSLTMEEQKLLRYLESKTNRTRRQREIFRELRTLAAGRAKNIERLHTDRHVLLQKSELAGEDNSLDAAAAAPQNVESRENPIALAVPPSSKDLEDLLAGLQDAPPLSTEERQSRFPATRTILITRLRRARLASLARPRSKTTRLYPSPKPTRIRGLESTFPVAVSPSDATLSNANLLYVNSKAENIFNVRRVTTGLDDEALLRSRAARRAAQTLHLSKGRRFAPVVRLRKTSRRVHADLKGHHLMAHGVSEASKLQSVALERDKSEEPPGTRLVKPKLSVTAPNFSQDSEFSSFNYMDYGEDPKHGNRTF